jgi:hypothetical protein
MKNQLNLLLALTLGTGALGTGAVAQEARSSNGGQTAGVEHAVFDPAQTGLLRLADGNGNHRCDGDHDRDDKHCRDWDRDRYRDRDYRGNRYYAAPYNQQNGWYDRKGNFYPYGANGYFDKHGKWHYFHGRHDDR